MTPAKIGSIVAAALFAAVSTTAAAQSPMSYKIGFVNTEKVMSEARAAVEAKQKLEAEFAKRDKEIAAGPASDVERRRRILVEDMTQRRDEVLKQIVDKANATIKRIAEQENLDAVFLEAVYFSPSVDITAKVIKALDAGR